MRLLFSILFSLAFCAGAPAQSITPITVVYVDADRLTVRAGPSADADIVGTVDRGASMIAVEIDGDWALLEDTFDMAGVEGWVRAADLAEPGSRQQDATPPEATPPLTRAPDASTDPFRYRASGLECNEDLYNGGFDSCALAVRLTVSIPEVYSPFLVDSLDVDCDVELTYRTDGSSMTRSAFVSDDARLDLSSGYDSRIFYLQVDFAFNRDPIVSAQLANLRCRPE